MNCCSVQRDLNGGQGAAFRDWAITERRRTCRVPLLARPRVHLGGARMHMTSYDIIPATTPRDAGRACGSVSQWCDRSSESWLNPLQRLRHLDGCSSWCPGGHTRCIVLLNLPLVHRSSMSPRLTSTVPGHGQMGFRAQITHCYVSMAALADWLRSHPAQDPRPPIRRPGRSGSPARHRLPTATPRQSRCALRTPASPGQDALVMVIMAAAENIALHCCEAAPADGSPAVLRPSLLSRNTFGLQPD